MLWAEEPRGPWEAGEMVGSFLLNISVITGVKLSVNVFFKPDGSVLLAQVSGPL